MNAVGICAALLNVLHLRCSAKCPTAWHMSHWLSVITAMSFTKPSAGALAVPDVSAAIPK